MTETEQFEQDMEEAGLEPYHYHGRFFWHGPAVTTDDIQAVIRATEVDVQWDQMGRGYVVYPKAGEPGHSECRK